MTSRESRAEQRRLIEGLVFHTYKLEKEVAAYLDRFPSPRIAHRLGCVNEMRVALIFEKGLLIVADQKEADREQQQIANEEIRTYDTHSRAMAEKLGITPGAFLAEQERRRQELDAPKLAPTDAATRPPAVDDMEDPNE